MMLEAKDLTFYYRNRKHAPVIDHFDLTVAPGERVGLTGPSGRGKTTLCRLLAGYENQKAAACCWTERRSADIQASVRYR